MTTDFLKSPVRTLIISCKGNQCKPEWLVFSREAMSAVGRKHGHCPVNLYQEPEQLEAGLPA